MPLNSSQRVQISGELLDIPLKIAQANNTIAQLDEFKQGLLDQDDSLKIFFDKFNAQVNAYQNEHKYLDGTTYAEVTNQDVIDGAKRATGNKFFAPTYYKFKPFLHNSAKGLPTTITPGSESEFYTDLYFSELLDFMLNGQTSAVPDDTTTAAYTSGTLLVTAGGQTVGNLILVQDGTEIGLFKVTNVASLTLTVEEVIPPTGTLGTGADVIENLPAFTSTEKNTLVSGTYQELLTELTNTIISKVATWETILNSQLTELNNNDDSRATQLAEITAAKASINNVLSNINFWQALPSTGNGTNDSKFDDANITILINDVNTRTAFIPTRATQITTAFGTITQDAEGIYTGSGIYFNRFVQIDSRINLVGGPLTEFYEKDSAITALTEGADTQQLKADTYSSELLVTKLTDNATGTNTINVEDASGFSNGNAVYVVADGLTELTGTITNIVSNTVTLSFTVANTYTTTLRARLYKQL